MWKNLLWCVEGQLVVHITVVRMNKMDIICNTAHFMEE
jgi:hypothetical protein